MWREFQPVEQKVYMKNIVYPKVGHLLLQESFGAEQHWLTERDREEDYHSFPWSTTAVRPNPL